MRIGLSLPWGSPKNIDLSQFTGNPEGEIDDVKFEVLGENNEVELDAWVVIDDLFFDSARAIVRNDEVIYVSAENIHSPDIFLKPDKQRFLGQFSAVYSCFSSFQENADFAPPFLPWMVNGNHGTVFTPHERDVNFLSGIEPMIKEREISVFCSDKSATPEQRLRLSFVEELKRYFGSAIDWFGNGINTVEQKWDGLAPYRVTLALENRESPGMYTEKILDPYLAWSFPVYWGAPDIMKFLPVDSSQILDFRDLGACKRQIREALEKSSTSEAIDQMKEARESVLGELHFLRRMVAIVKSRKSRSSPDSSSTLKKVGLRRQRRFKSAGDFSARTLLTKLLK